MDDFFSYINIFMKSKKKEIYIIIFHDFNVASQL
jgi:hypothetical protein